MNAEDRETLLAVDVGNTRIKFGLIDSSPRGASASALPDCPLLKAIPTSTPLDWGEITAFVESAASRVVAAVVAGVNPPAIESVASTWPKGAWPRPRIILHATELPVLTTVPIPDHVGIDRLLNAVAANVLRPAGRAALVVSAGTATTVDLVDESGAFAGGAIMPGLEIGARALHQHTALLPLIDIPALLQSRADPLGKETHGAIRAGLWHGQVGAIRELVARLSELAAQPPLILITGGNGRALAPALGPDYRFESELALRGLAHTVLMNPSAGSSTGGRAGP